MGSTRERTRFVGVYQRVSDTGTHKGKPDVCFDITYKSGSRKVWEKVGWKSEGYTAAMASQIRSERVRDLRHGTVIPKPRSAITLREAWASYLENHITGRSCEESHACLYRIHIDPTLGNRSLDDITELDIATLAQSVAGKGRSPQTAKTVLVILRAAMHRAIKWKLWSGPMPSFEMPRVDNTRFRFLTVQEAAALLDEIGLRSTQWRNISALALNTGMRAGEIFRLHGEHIDLDSGLIHCEGKGGRWRDIPINQGARAVLASLPLRPGQLVFTDRYGLMIEKVSVTFPKSVDALGLNDGVADRRGHVVFHSLRHTFASWLVMDGVPLYTVSKLLGHASITMTERYAKLAPGGLRAAAMRLDRITGNHVSAPPVSTAIPGYPDADTSPDAPPDTEGRSR